KEVVDGKRVVIIDDSVMRGTTSRKIIKMIRQAGAKEIHFRVSAPPTISPCYYGIDIPTHKELIAATHSIEEIKKYLRVDSIAYLTLETMNKAVEEHKGGGFCDACFTANYPVEFQDHAGNQKSLFAEYATEE
nr:amidophosphoribosyltransferase [Leptospira sp.]